MERVFKVLDLPRRGDIEALNANLQRVAEAVESLQHAEPGESAASGKSDVKPDGKPGVKSGSRSSGKPGDEPGGRSSDEPGDEIR
jgi:hypothetical protein